MFFKQSAIRELRAASLDRDTHKQLWAEVDNVFPVIYELSSSLGGYAQLRTVAMGFYST